MPAAPAAMREQHHASGGFGQAQIAFELRGVNRDPH
jgi:hypothetical protein